MLDDNQKPWPLNVDKPTAAQLMDWAIRLTPKVALANPSEAIQKVTALYMRAGEAATKWGKITSEYKRDEASRLEGPLLIASTDDDDTMMNWLDENTDDKDERTDRLRFKSGKSLLEAIRTLREEGIATERIELFGKADFRVERLRGHLTWQSITDDSNINIRTSCRLSEKTAQEFLRLRRLKRDNESLQKDWKASLDNALTRKNAVENSEK